MSGERRARPDATRGRPTRRRRSRLLLGVLAAASLLVAAEVVVRVSGVFDVEAAVATEHQRRFNEAGMFVAPRDGALAYRNRPSSRIAIDGLVYEHDERGRRVAPAIVAPPPDAVAVAFLGDSTTYGWGVDGADALPAQVERASGGKIRALNYGVSGFGLIEQLALYRAERDRLGADTVVLVVFANDLSPLGFSWDEDRRLLYLDPMPWPPAVERLLWNSALYRAVASRRAAELDAAGAFDPTRPENWDVPLAALAELVAEIERDGRRLLVAHLPAMERLDPYVYAAPRDAIRELCAAESVPFVDLLDAFLARRAREIEDYEARTGEAVDADLARSYLSRFWIDPRDHHLNPEANRIAAEALARVVLEWLERS